MELGKVTDYVQNVLGLNAFEDIQFKDEDRFIPNICILTFSMAGYMIEDVPCVLLSPFEDSTQVSILMKRADLVRQAVNRPCILILTSLDSMNRRQLIYNKVPFIIPGKQLYLPFLGTLLSDRGMGKKKKVQSLSPSSQFLLLYHFQKESLENISLLEVSERLKYSQKTISLAASELSELGLCAVERLHGNVKYLRFIDRPANLWRSAFAHMKQPIAKVLYIPEQLLGNLPGLVMSYDSALEYYTDISAPAYKSYAIEKSYAKAINKGYESPSLFEGAVRLELWKYSPSAITNNGYIDPLSMALCYKDEDDERVQGEIDKLLHNKLW